MQLETQQEAKSRESERKTGNEERSIEDAWPEDAFRTMFCFRRAGLGKLVLKSDGRSLHACGT